MSLQARGWPLKPEAGPWSLRLTLEAWGWPLKPEADPSSLRLSIQDRVRAHFISTRKSPMDFKSASEWQMGFWRRARFWRFEPIHQSGKKCWAMELQKKIMQRPEDRSLIISSRRVKITPVAKFISNGQKWFSVRRKKFFEVKFWARQSGA